MLPYFAIYGVLALLGLKRPEGRTVNLVLLSSASIFLVWFAGLRFFVGCDYHSYVLRYSEAKYLDWSYILSHEEWGFGGMTALFAKAGAPFEAFQASVSAIIIFLYARFAWRHHYALYLLALFFPILVLQLGMSGIRQAMAVGFIMLAYNAFIDKKRLMIGIWVIVAFLFHNSAIILLPMAFIAGRQISIPRLVGGFILLAPLAAYLLGDRIDVYSARYVEQLYGTQDSGGAWFRFALSALPVVFFLQYRVRIKAKFPEVYQLLLFGALFIAAISLSGLISTVAVHRLTYFSLPLSILMTLYISLTAAKNPTNGFVAWLAVYGAYLVVWFTVSRHASVCFMPYQNVMFPNNIVPDWALFL